MPGFLLLLVLLLTVGTAGLARAQAPPLTFTGKATDPAGRPAGGATVIANVWAPPRMIRGEDRPPARYKTGTDARGAFRLVVPVARGDWEVVLLVLKEGYGAGGEALHSPSPTRGLTLALTQPGFIAGRVVDRAGHPIPGAALSLRWLMRPSSEASLQFAGAGPRVTTNAQGRFRLGPLPADALAVLSADHPAYAPLPGGSPPLAAGTDDATLALPPPGTIRGRVLFADGKPAAHVPVYCQVIGSTLAVETDGSGQFRFSRLPAGNYLFRAAPGGSPDLVSEIQGVALADGAEARCPDLHLVGGGLVTGRVTNEKGEPLADVGIISQLELPISSLWMTANGPTARTAADGTYRLRLPPSPDPPRPLPGPPPGWHVKTDLYPEGALEDEERVVQPAIRVTEGQTTRFDLRVPQPVTLRARVLDARGRPAQDAVAQVANGGLLLTRKTDETGRFVVTGLMPAQTARLLVFSRDRREGARLELRPEQQRGERVIHLQLLPAVTGTVRDAQGAPVVGALVGAEQIMHAGFATGIMGVNRTKTDVRGEFSLPLFPDAQYQVSAGAQGFAPVPPVSVEVGAAGRDSTGGSPVQFVLERADGVVAGVVVDQDGQPAAGAQVEVERSDDVHGRYPVGRAVTDREGRFRVAHLPPGELLVSASGLRTSSDRHKVMSGATDLSLVLIPWEDPAAAPPLPHIGAAAPEIHVERWVNGRGVRSLSELRGKTVVLQFSTPLNPAARASDALLKAHAVSLKQAGRQDVVILALYDRSATPDELAASARAEGVPYPIGIGPKSSVTDIDSSPFSAYGVRQLPTLLVIDQEGNVRAVNPSPEELKRLLEMQGP